MVLAGYQPDSQDDAAFLKCLHDAHLDPAEVAARSMADSATVTDCTRGYEASHIDMSGATQAQFSFHLLPSPYHPGNVIISLMNKSADKILLGADLLFHSNGRVELRHIATIAFPGHPAQAETPVSLLSEGAEPSDFGFSAIPAIARIADPSVYRAAASPR
jgi:hypothetical protein